jgi:hypothetical protein
VPALGLVLIHRGVGVPDELLYGATVLGPDAATDARADRDDDVAELERLEERGPHPPFCGADLIALIDLGEDDGELVAT